MHSKIKIGTWQGPVADNDFHTNLQKVKSVLEDSRNLGLDFLCFPETYLSGYSVRAIQKSACSLDHPEIIRFIDESKKYGTVILVGMSEKVKDQIYNSQLVVYQGDLLGVAHKTMLTEYDARYFSTDLSLPVFTAKGIKFGVAICHSTSFVEPALYLRWKGARLLFTPHFNNQPPAGFVQNGKAVSFWEHRTMVLNNQAALATLLKMVVVRSNIVVVEPNALGVGDSNIWDMDGVLVAQSEPFTECLVTAEFDRQIFLEEHWIDRLEVPLALLDMIAQAAKEYPR
jgi:predicted amidohydrolase